MPDDSKRNTQKKGRHDPKEQRKPRQRNQPAQPQNKTEDIKGSSNISAPQKPAPPEPGPEFYQNLKRETDEIIKITTEEKTKYKKKEIQSNWSKYEIPIESYDEIEEQENIGADYEKLIQAPMSIGGHFQFKHEKNWDVDISPSMYDKFFEINMQDLSIALQTIPFHERIDVDKSIFTETDMQNMNNRATRFKQKYFKNKSYSVPDLEVQEKIINSLRENIKDCELTGSNDDNADIDSLKTLRLDHVDEIKINLENQHKNEKNILKRDSNDVVICDSSNDDKTGIESFKSLKIDHVNQNKINLENQHKNTGNEKTVSLKKDTNDFDLNFKPNVDEIQLSPNYKPPNDEIEVISQSSSDEIKANRVKMNKPIEGVINDISRTNPVTKPIVEEKKIEFRPAVTPRSEVAAPKAPAIESPEDLEKWLDDFLDS